MNHLTPHIIGTKYIEPVLPGLSKTAQARFLGISRGSIYYEPHPADPVTLDLMRRIDKIHTDWPVYGARKIVRQLRRDFRREAEEARKLRLPATTEGISIGRKRIRSLMETMAIEAIYPKPHLSQNKSPHPVFPYLLKGLFINRPNQVWGSDITYIRMHGGFLYLVVFLDWYSRFVVGWRLSTTLETGFVLEAAREALSIYGHPEITNVDQGVQFTDNDFIGLWDKERTKISMDHKGRCFDNIFTERFWRTLKYYEVYLKDYQTIREAKKNIGNFINRYNNVYLHESLDYNTPAEFYYAKN